MLWLVLAAAFLGWMFDGMEQGLLTAVARSALQDLLGKVRGRRRDWPVDILYHGCVSPWGRLRGRGFGWLGDRIGRVRGMALSILVFSAFTGACCFVAHPWQLACLEFFAGTGMGGEWALGVAIVVECWPDRLRPMLSGAIGSAANCRLPVDRPAGDGVSRHARALALGRGDLLDAGLAALFILAFLPESKRWQESARCASGDPLREIFTTRLLRLVLLGIALASVALIGTWACAVAFLPSWADQLAGAPQRKQGRWS